MCEGFGGSEFRGALQGGPVPADQTDRRSAATAENQEEGSSQWQEGESSLRFTASVQYTTPNSRLTSAQVLPMRKSGVIPLEQFKVSDEEEDEEDTAVLEKKVYSVNMSEAALKVCLKELKRWSFLHGKNISVENLLRLNTLLFL